MKKISLFLSICVLLILSCSAPEESKTESEDSMGSDTNDNSTSLALIWDQGSWDSHYWQ